MLTSCIIIKTHVKYAASQLPRRELHCSLSHWSCREFQQKLFGTLISLLGLHLFLHISHQIQSK